MPGRTWITAIAIFLALSARSTILPSPASGSRADDQERGSIEVIYAIGDAKSPLVSPTSVAVNERQKEVYVCDRDANKINIYDLSGIAKFTFACKSPRAVAAGPDQEITAAIAGGSRIAVFDCRGRIVREVGFSGLPFANPPVVAQIAVGKDATLYTADTANNMVTVTDLEGKYKSHFGKPVDGEGITFEELSGFCLSGNRIYIVDGKAGKVHVFKTSGKHLFTMGEKGGTTGKLSMPSSVTVDSRGNIIVLDRKRHCLSIYDELGEYKGEAGGEGSKPGWFYYPLFVTIDGNDRLYICEHFNKRVQVIKLTLPWEKKPNDK